MRPPPAYQVRVLEFPTGSVAWKWERTTKRLGDPSEVHFITMRDVPDTVWKRTNAPAERAMISDARGCRGVPAADA